MKQWAPTSRPRHLAMRLEAARKGAEDFRTMAKGRLTVFVGREPTGKHDALRWHLSISHTNRYPNWDEIKEARYYFIPDTITVAMFLPPRDQYVNISSNCFHLHELEPDDVDRRLIT